MEWQQGTNVWMWSPLLWLIFAHRGCQIFDLIQLFTGLFEYRLEWCFCVYHCAFYDVLSKIIFVICINGSGDCSNLLLKKCKSSSINNPVWLQGLQQPCFCFFVVIIPTTAGDAQCCWCTFLVAAILPCIIGHTHLLSNIVPSCVIHNHLHNRKTSKQVHLQHHFNPLNLCA